jgi:SAM-dependent methyltransferase
VRLVFPPPPGFSEPCVWTGRYFVSAGERLAILAYKTGESGWTDDLTTFHEETAGADHYIDVASRENAIRSLEKHLSDPAPLIIDIGCSSGLLIERLKTRLPHATIMGADYAQGPLQSLVERMPGIPLLQFDLASCPLPDACVNGVVALNVLEHIEDDRAAMRQIHRILKPGGVAVIEVPAGPHLYDLYDQELMHFRRYRMPELMEKARSADLEIIDHSHLGVFIYPAFAFVKKRNRWRMNVPENRRQNIVAGNIEMLKRFPVMHSIMKVEEALRPYVYYPFGVRCLLTCRRA